MKAKPNGRVSQKAQTLGTLGSQTKRVEGRVPWESSSVFIGEPGSAALLCCSIGGVAVGGQKEVLLCPPCFRIEDKVSSSFFSVDERVWSTCQRIISQLLRL